MGCPGKWDWSSLCPVFFVLHKGLSPHDFQESLEGGKMGQHEHACQEGVPGTSGRVWENSPLTVVLVIAEGHAFNWASLFGCLGWGQEGLCP